MILAGDVGGTKVHLALYNFEGGRLKPVRDQKFPAHEFATLDAVVEKFLGMGWKQRQCGFSPLRSARRAEGMTAERSQIVAACFGCPGPVRDGRLKLTNLPWTLDERDLAEVAGDRAHLFDQ